MSKPSDEEVEGVIGLDNRGSYPASPCPSGTGWKEEAFGTTTEVPGDHQSGSSTHKTGKGGCCLFAAFFLLRHLFSKALL